MTPVHLFRRTLIALALGCASGTALTADWATVATDRGKKIEIDRDSVLRAEGGKKVAWGRLVLSEADAEKTGYAMVQALNRYDCQSLKCASRRVPKNCARWPNRPAAQRAPPPITRAMPAGSSAPKW